MLRLVVWLLCALASMVGVVYRLTTWRLDPMYLGDQPRHYGHPE